MIRRNDALVKTNWRLQAPLQLRVVYDVVVGQGLLDQQEVESVEVRQMFSVIQRVDAVGVNLKPQVGPSFAYRPRRGEIPPRFNLELDPLVARCNITRHDTQQAVEVRLHPNADAHLNLRARAAKHLAQTATRQASEEIPGGELKTGLRHPVPAHLRVASSHILRPL